MKYGAWSAPVVLSLTPAIIFFVLFFIFGSSPPAAISLLALSVITLLGGFILGLIITGGILFYRSRWLAGVRERLAIDGIKASEVEWFKHELKTGEKKIAG